MDLGGPSLYGLEFRRPDGSHVVALWTPRGRRPVKLAFESKGSLKFVDIPIPGRPTEIGLWVNGNSSWGRVIFVLQDASGRQWRSLTEQSPIDFDGWRYLAVHLPPQYPGPENHNWPRDKDAVAHYPLTFKKLIVEMPQKVLHVKSFSPVPRPEIYLKDLTAGQDDTTMLKTTVGERD